MIDTDVMNEIDAKIKYHLNELVSAIATKRELLNPKKSNTIEIEIAVKVLKSVINPIVKKAHEDNLTYNGSTIKDDFIEAGARNAEIVRGRSYFYKILKDNYPNETTLKALGTLLEPVRKPHHSTIIHSLKEFEDRYIYEKIFKEEYDIVLAEYNERMKLIIEAKNG
jgi:hypothetical protein